MASLDDVLNGTNSDENAANTAVDNTVGTNTGETGKEAQPTGEGQSATDPATGAPPTPEDGKLVPLKALEEERKGRKDWKERAIRYEEELKHLRESNGQTQTPQADQPIQMDMQTAMFNERLNNSEMLLRSKHDDVDEKLAVFQAAVAKNPALQTELTKQRHPYEWMYKEAQKLQALNEIGDDPTTYEQKIRAKIMAELEASNESQPTQQSNGKTAPNLPKSLATARSVGARNATTWTGPTSLGDILSAKR